MIIPIVAFGHPVLKKKALPIENNYPDLQELITNMFETMYAANGVGLAAPQIDLSIRLIVIDGSALSKDYPETDGFKKVFINPEILEESGENRLYNEGCLSVPEIHEDVSRKERVKLRYFDETFAERIEEFHGMRARIIQHEYDHLEGKVFIDRLSPLRRTLLKKRLSDIAQGKKTGAYKMRFAKK